MVLLRWNPSRAADMRGGASNLRLAATSVSPPSREWKAQRSGADERAKAVARLPARLHRNGSAEAEGEGVEPPTACTAPVFETGYRTSGSPSVMAPAGFEPAPC